MFKTLVEEKNGVFDGYGPTYAALVGADLDNVDAKIEEYKELPSGKGKKAVAKRTAKQSAIEALAAAKAGQLALALALTPAELTGLTTVYKKDVMARALKQGFVALNHVETFRTIQEKADAKGGDSGVTREFSVQINGVEAEYVYHIHFHDVINLSQTAHHLKPTRFGKDRWSVPSGLGPLVAVALDRAVDMANDSWTPKQRKQLENA